MDAGALHAGRWGARRERVSERGLEGEGAQAISPDEDAKVD
jgi:hypothetical protein